MTLGRSLLATVLVASAFIVQVCALTQLHLPGATPDLLLLVVVGLALQWGPQAGAVIGFAAGMLLDLAPPADGPLARWAFALTLVGFGVGRWSEDRELSLLMPLGAVIASAVSAELVAAAVGALVGEPGTTWARVLPVMSSAAAYDVVLSPFVVPVVLAMARALNSEPTPSSRR